MYRIKLHPQAAKFFSNLDGSTKNRIKETLLSLKENPFEKRPKVDIKKLKGTKGRQDLYRLRVGGYRIVYAVEGDNLFITDIFKREKGYKGV